jgi:uncharacterized membrane protein YhaH (DUF805 family)
MTITESIKTCLKKTFVYSGRASRTEFWYFTLVCTLVMYPLGAVQNYLTFTYGDVNSRDLINYIFQAINLLLGLPLLAVTTRRLHDVNRSGWWQLLTIPLITIPILIYWMLKASDPEANKYGQIEWPANDGKLASIVCLLINIALIALTVIFLYEPTKEVFKELQHWEYSEEIDPSTKQATYIARHISQDKENRKIFVQYALVCSNSDLVFALATYDNPNQTLGKPDVNLPAAILQENGKAQITGALESTKDKLTFESGDDKNTTAALISKKMAGELSKNVKLILDLKTDRGPLHLQVNTSDEGFQKVLHHCAP